MATLFALGLMSITWIAVIAGVVALEKVLPWERGANRGVALLLIVLALGVALAPDHVPGLTVPAADAPDGVDGSAELRAVRRVLEGRLVAAAAGQLELQSAVLDAEQVRDDLPTGSVMARDHAGHRLLVATGSRTRTVT